MVNTRRKESNGSPSGPTHRTRGSLRLIKQEPVEESESSSVNESDSDDSDDKDSSCNIEEETKPSVKTATTPLPPRQLRSKFGYTNKYSQRPLRNDHKRISLDERTLTVYSRGIHDDSDVYEQDHDTDDEIYTVRGRRTRHLVRMNRIQRRTALSLRPISQKCYADPHSPLQFNSDSESRVRRSTRKRPSNMSWLDDSQMHKVGYPNLNTGYSEEDSRDAGEAHNDMELPRKNPRKNSDIRLRHNIKPPKYLFDYGVEEAPRRLRRAIQKDEINQERTSNDKENKKEDNVADNKLNGRLRSSKNLSYVEEKDTSPEEELEEKIAESKENAKTEKPIKDVKKDQSSGSDGEEEAKRREELPVTRLRPTTRNRRNYPTRSDQTGRSQKQRNMIDTSSESEEEGRKYSLRDRRTKPAPKTMQQSVLKTRTRRFTRRTQESSSSSDSSSEICRKAPKTAHHSKNEKMKSGAGGSTNIVPIKPETLDNSIRFNSIGGLDAHIQCLKEMILLPMMYPEVFRQFCIQPPRGVLFHGPPGTGKTLIARALANECSFGTRKVSFFLRKGADLLSKWIGESEKMLRQLFEQAAEMKPSIIFFDELDGLAPVRSSRQDQIHASIVSTLLALMDGLSDRGEVIVIGATNRIDAIDPALRRPGRFDRELLFTLPSKDERKEILCVHTSSWKHPPNNQLLEYLSEHTVGYCGSDLRALCSEAVIQSFRRTYPQVYNSEYRLLLEPETVKVEKVDFMRAKSLLIPASHRVTQGLGRKLFPILEPLLQETIKESLERLRRTFPHGLSTSLAKVKLSPNMRPAQLLITGNGSDHGQTTHVAPDILYKMEHIHAYILNLVMLYQDTGRSTEEACIKVFIEAKRNVPSIIYIPNIDKWWCLVSETVRAIFKSQLTSLDPNVPILLLATADSLYENLPTEIQNLFSYYRKEVLELKPPSVESRRQFFKPLIVDGSLKPVKKARELPRTPPPLPRAPTPPPLPLNEEQSKKLHDEEEHTLRELRIFLRDMCKKLANNKLFFMFTKPVDTEEVPDYTNIIKQPMDLETMMTKVDFHRYECASDFLNDIELICRNALEYNPARTSADKQIRHRACSLRDYAYTLIKTEMDTDFEEKCIAISRKRRERKHCPTKYLPPYIYTPELLNETLPNGENEEENGKIEEKSDNKNANRKRKRFRWQRGRLLKTKKRKFIDNPNVQNGDKETSEDSNDDADEKSCRIGDKDDDKVEGKENSVVEPTTPLTVNCDIQNNKTDTSNVLQSPRRRLSDILSPSELLDNPLDFDDVDEALNESAIDSITSTSKPIECSEIELEKALETAVRITEGLSLVSLLDLYNHLSTVVKKFSRTNIRTNLPKELLKELARFKRECAVDFNTQNKFNS
ncbi:ATPase family AAA domain-containing protein 2-like isoform X2 [Diorhabda carinulata]|uniref:ATPase family AAA domain-containing protein 2-like isoform X2 n=1 Tax=Diorhabda carinulata TaxID=1163345 RepID=UPI0025A02A4C|nr:ATPase family AAA domain-containing protein 2-like isoform X2 [Diorhabda carinulata]